MKVEYLIGNKIISIEDIKSFLLKCNNDFFPELSTRVNIPDYASKLYNNSILIVAKANNKQIGLTAFYANNFEEYKAFLSNINVVPSFQGKGIANTLIEMMIKYLKSNGFKEVSLEVHENNNKAILTYQKFGFHVIQRRNDFIIMTSKIK